MYNIQHLGDVLLSSATFGRCLLQCALACIGVWSCFSQLFCCSDVLAHVQRLFICIVTIYCSQAQNFILEQITQDAQTSVPMVWTQFVWRFSQFCLHIAKRVLLCVSFLWQLLPDGCVALWAQRGGVVVQLKAFANHFAMFQFSLLHSPFGGSLLFAYVGLLSFLFLKSVFQPFNASLSLALFVGLYKNVLSIQLSSSCTTLRVEQHFLKKWITSSKVVFSYAYNVGLIDDVSRLCVAYSIALRLFIFASKFKENKDTKQ